MAETVKAPNLFTETDLTNYTPRGDLIERIRQLVEQTLTPTMITVEDPISGVIAPAALTTEGVKPIPASIFDDYLPGPRRRKGIAKLTSLDALIDHVNRFKSESTAIFAVEDRTNPKLIAVLDYHPATGEGGEIQAAHMGHRAEFAFPLSDEWKAWHGVDGKDLRIPEFAEFIEDRIVDVIPPDLAELSDNQRTMVDKLGGPDRIASPSMLFELSKGLQVRVNANVKNATRLENGEGELIFTEEHTDVEGRPLTVPTTFLLGIPVFRNGDPYQVLARLRYRVNNGLVTFRVDLWRDDQVFDHAFTEAVQRVEDVTARPTYLGTPEA